MSYADAAHHAPATSDPTPNPSLLVSKDEPLSNPGAKHVKVAPEHPQEPEAPGGGASVVPQKRESDSQQPTPTGAPAATANSNGKKSSKKGKKNKKDTATVAPTTDTSKQAAGDKAKEESSKVQPDKKEPTTERQDESDSAQADKPQAEQSVEKKGGQTNEKSAESDEPKAHARTKTSSASSANGDDNDQADKEDSKRDDGPAGKDFETQLAGMRERPTVSKDLDQKLADPYVPRANIAASVEHPNGTTENDYAEAHKDESVLQQHVGFFDRDNDGVIWPSDTFVGFHNLGYSLIWCILSVFLIHPTFSYFTLSSWIPDPFFRIRVKTIHRARHGSDTGVYDSQGRFVSAKFEEIFEKFDKGKKGGLTFLEGLAMIRENRNVLDPIGWIGAFFEWFASYLLIWPKNGVVNKEDLRTIYDGSLFYAVAEKESTVRARQHRFYSGLFKENRSSDVKKYNKKIQ
ncbi:hypothetical protein JCM11491_000028 [Sporobolomyces phaffii]